ncbi:hypothetical protein LWF15_11360 [Kineosporia rhizophila]|uniref:hypothetical protein n=1 Tax=Kineosporia rhizophila TaxID=84633 RepID=UPI001E5D724A|nr:hypothetical protein [Kineosporia rhizophila]MCE0536108.1 hypothetical protein [Kineosporia rhizophila]
MERTAAAMAMVAAGDQDVIEALGDVHQLPRPWDPGTCPAPLRAQIWHWCDLVAGWINAQLLWRPTQMIPACWPAHPHIAHELPLLACQRLNAEKSFDPAALEEWHRYTLAYFLDRLRDRLGDSSCRDGKHMDWPGRARQQSFQSPAAMFQRGEHFAADTDTPNPYQNLSPTKATDSEQHSSLSDVLNGSGRGRTP